MKSENLPPVRWRNVVSFGNPAMGKYIVSNYGEIRHVFDSGKFRVMKPTNRTRGKGSGRMVFRYFHDGKASEYMVHRIVWEAFNGTVPNGMCIVHRNMDHTDNALWNLKLMSRTDVGKRYSKLASLQKRYAYAIRRGNKEHSRTIAHINKDGEILAVYRSSRDAENGYKYLSFQAILDRCNHRVKKPFLEDGTTFVWEEELVICDTYAGQHYDRGDCDHIYG